MHAENNRKKSGITEELDTRYPDNSMALSLLAQAQIVNNKKPLAEQTLFKLINLEKQDVAVVCYWSSY